MTNKIVAPGDVIVSVSAGQSGEGTYVHKNSIRAALLGKLEKVDSQEKGGLPTFSVVSHREEFSPSVPAIGQRVTAKVSRINPRFVSCQILCVNRNNNNSNSSGLNNLVIYQQAFVGMVRTADVRSTDIDKIEINKCFLPGDVIVAEVLSLGDSHSYYLSTAKDDLGVVHATSVAGGTLKAISATEMECPITNTIELRKVALAINNDDDERADAMDTRGD